MLTVEQIATLIENDETSDRKRLARMGSRYYEGLHDIRDYRLFYYDAEGKLTEDKTRSNIKISHPFFTELVDQQVQYMLSGGESFAKTDDQKLQDELDAYFGDDFTAELYDTLTDCVSKGFGYMYAYKGADDRTRFQYAESLGVVEVRARETDDDTEYVIYWYIDRINRERQAIKRIQVWDAEKCTYYKQVEDGAIELDEDEEINPRPHTVYTDGEDGALYYEGFGFIPFFRIDNNRKQVSGLKPVKELIDDYDLMSCGLSNNIQDTAEALYVVSGFQGNDLGELIENIKVKKHIGVDDNGSVDIKTVDIPYQARQAKLELDEKNIYRFGMGFNSAQLGDGNVTNVVIKSRYALLDLKCNKLEIRLRQFLRRILEVVVAEVNARLGSDYQPGDVRFEFGREVMTNALDNATIEQTEANTQQIRANTLLNVAQALDSETVLRGLCEVLDLDYDEVSGRVAKEAETEEQRAMGDLMAAPTEEEAVTTDEQGAEGSAAGAA